MRKGRDEMHTTSGSSLTMTSARLNRRALGTVCTTEPDGGGCTTLQSGAFLGRPRSISLVAGSELVGNFEQEARTQRQMMDKPKTKKHTAMGKLSDRDARSRAHPGIAQGVTRRVAAQ